MDLTKLSDTTGENAGLIWKFLDSKGEIPFNDLQKKTKLPDAEFYLAIGWLLREGKLCFFEKDKEQMVLVLY